MRIAAFDLTRMLRTMAPEAALAVRDRDSGLGVMHLTPHECQILCERESCEGVATRRGYLKYVRLTVDTRTALADLRRKLYSTGRTVAEASQLTSRRNIPGAGVVWSHNLRRIRAYDPLTRQGSHPTYEVLREATVLS